MKKNIVTLSVTVMCLLGLSQQASAQTVPNVSGLKAFTAQTRYLSLPGYLRWQYFMENDQWISFDEANELLKEKGN